jgi:NADPH-dependent 7-cyano-7-deazaguanine reductase QueF
MFTVLLPPGVNTIAVTNNNNNNNKDLKAETESEIVAAQDQALQTKHYATKILNTEADSKCRLCHQFDETTDYILSACPIQAKEQ